MTQFEVYRNPSEASQSFAPFVVVLQSHHLALDTVLVAPLVTDKLPTSVEPAIHLDGRSFVVAVTEMGSIRAASLTHAVGVLRDHEDAIRRALDRLFTGF